MVKRNNRIGNNRDQNNWRAIIEDTVDGIICVVNVIDGVTDVVDATNKVFAKVFTYFFGLPSPNLTRYPMYMPLILVNFFCLLFWLMLLLQIVLVTKSNFFYLLFC